MCQLDTEGTKFTACGHYIITKKLTKYDCKDPYCTKSSRHRNPCPGCQCNRYYAPDHTETVTAVRHEFCPECAPYYRRVR